MMIDVIPDRSSRRHWCWRGVRRVELPDEQPGQQDEEQAGTTCSQHTEAGPDRRDGRDQPEHREDVAGRRRDEGGHQEPGHGRARQHRHDAQQQEGQLLDRQHRGIRQHEVKHFGLQKMQ